jgi:Rrf2 family transcriptional regulator, cysteine metabolism repressor
MQLLTKETDYAIRALIHIAALPDRSSTASTISEKERIPWLFLRRVLQKLAAAGVLRSTKGRGGGFLLVRRPDRVTMLDVIQVFQGDVEMNQCMVKGIPCCNRPTCPVRRRLKAVEKVLKRELAAITIAMLVQARRMSESD